MVLLFDGPILRAPWWDMPENRQSRSIALPQGPQAAATPPGGTSPAAPAAPANSGPSLPNTQQKLALAKKLLAESDDHFSWVAGQLGINTSTLWRWRKAGKLG